MAEPGDAVAAWQQAVARRLAGDFCDRIVSDPTRPVPSKLLRALGSDRPRYDHARLTPREQEVTRLVACGWPDRNIAAALGVSYHTAVTLVRHASQRIGVRNRTHLVALAIRRGLI